MSVEQFLRQRAVNVSVSGRCTRPNWYDPQGRLRSFPCRTTRVSPFRMLVDAPISGKVGENLKVYFHEFGKFDGSISETINSGFLLEIQATPSSREKLASKLTWLERKQKDPGLPDRRRHPRFIPENPESSLTFADGTIHQCSVTDVSITGVAVSASVRPEIGRHLAVGACVGRVVREMPDGFAVEFVTPQKRGELDRLIACRASRMPAIEDSPPVRRDGKGFTLLDV